MATNLETKIQRIQTNVTAALAKIAEKGVTVPGDANSDDLEGLIGSIPVKEDLTAVLDAQEAAITALEAALEGKAGGGGSTGTLCKADIPYYATLFFEEGATWADFAETQYNAHYNQAYGQWENAINVYNNSVGGNYASTLITIDGTAETAVTATDKITPDGVYQLINVGG